MRALYALVSILSIVMAKTDLRDIRPTLKPLRTGPPKPFSRDMCRILDHNLAKPCQFPHMALVRSNMTYISAGSLITPTAVLTSATAVIGYESWSILLGAVHLVESNKGDTAWTIKSTWGMPHPLYNSTHFHNNVGVITLPRKAPLGDCIKPVALPSMKDVFETFVGKTALVSGWGFPPNSTVVSDDLIFTEVVIVANELCKKFYAQDYIIESTLCAANENRGIDNGDSGAPLVIWTSQGFKQVGVASFWSSMISTATVPAAYVRITAVLDWIHSVAGNPVFL